jgi:hypothetical protein
MKCVYICFFIILVWTISMHVLQWILMKLGWVWWIVLRKYICLFRCWIFLSIFLLLSSSVSNAALRIWLQSLQWTPELIVQWQEFYDNASRYLFYGRAGEHSIEYMAEIPKYEDLKPSECKRTILNSALNQKSFVLLIFISFVIRTFF